MTYCVGLSVNSGIIMLSDSRTNAGPDNVSAYSKMRFFEKPGYCQYVITSAGNLATTQSVFAKIERQIRHDTPGNLLTYSDIDAAADYVGDLSCAAQSRVDAEEGMFESSFLLAGEVRGETSGLKLIYPQGNSISSSRQTPYLQIGEAKYGQPIIDRIISPDSTLEEASVCALLSMIATMRSNMSVAPPIELYLYKTGSLKLGRHMKFEVDDPYLNKLKAEWNHSLASAVANLSPVVWPEQEKGAG